MSLLETNGGFYRNKTVKMGTVPAKLLIKGYWIFIYIYIYLHMCVCLFIYLFIHSCIDLSIYLFTLQKLNHRSTVISNIVQMLVRRMSLNPRTLVNTLRS